MATKDKLKHVSKINDGPGLMDLMLAHYDRKLPRNIGVFHGEPSSRWIYLEVDSAEALQPHWGADTPWLIKGRVASSEALHGQHYEMEYNTKTRKGTLTLFYS